MNRSIVAVLGLVAALLVPQAASAQVTAYARGNINMRAGPDTDYPVIATIGSGSVVNVYGCISGYDWCDVRVRNYRGWVFARRLEFPYRGRRVLIPEYGSAFGAPIIRFDFGYWDRYYRDRPFYRERGRWDRDWRDGPRRGRDRDDDRRGRDDRRDRDNWGDRDDWRDRDDGPRRGDGPGRDGPGRDGPWRDGPGRDGPGRDGPGRDGPGRDGPRDGRGPASPPPEPGCFFEGGFWRCP